MKKYLLLFTALLFSAYFAMGQVAQYTFQQSTGTYVDLGSSGTVIATPTANTLAGSVDDVVFNLPNDSFPFSFVFDGIGYTGCSISSNGFITFGSTAPVGGTYAPLSATLTYAGAISPWGSDANGIFEVNGVTSELSWALVGTAPNREVVIQWKNWRPAYSTSTTLAPYINYQIRLSESSNTIKIVYGPAGMAIGTTNTSRTPQIGLRGPNNTFATNVINRTNTTLQLFTASTAGTLNTSTQAYSSVNATPGTPTNGLTYTFTPPPPPACAAPSSLTVTNIQATTATISWTAPAAAPASGYEWEVRTSGAGGSGANGRADFGSTAEGVTTANVTDLTAVTTYNLYVRSNCGATFSLWTEPTAFTTPCAAVPDFNEGFEGATFPPSCWSVTGSSTWTRSTAAGGYGSSTASAYAYFYNFSAGTTLELISQPFSLANSQLSFDHAYATYMTEVDKLQIFYSTDNGSTYTQLVELLGGVTGPLNTGGASGSSFVPTASQWATKSYSLPAGTNMVKFKAISGYGNNLYLDNIMISEPITTDLRLSAFYQASGMTPEPGKNGSIVQVNKNSYIPGYRFAPTAELDVNSSGVTESSESTTEYYFNTDKAPNAFTLSPIDVVSTVENVAIDPASYQLNWLVNGVAQTPYNGPVVAPTATHNHTSVYTPTQRGTFLTSGSITVTDDGIPGNNSNSFRMLVYPDGFTNTVYDNGTNVQDTWVGWGSATTRMKAGVRFTADDFIIPAGVDFLINTEGLVTSDFVVEIRAAGSTTTAPGDVLYSRTYTDPVYYNNGGAYVHFPFNESQVPVIMQGSDYWITIEAPLGILYPGGVHNSGFSPGRSFYYVASSSTWSPLVIDTERAWIMRSIQVVTTPPPPCSAPSAQPTALVLTPASNSIGGSFTAAPGTTGYLIVQSTSSSLGAVPENFTTYVTGDVLGSGTVVGSGSGTSFNVATLNPGTQYYYTVYSYATGQQCMGPVYRTTSPLTGSVTTLPAAPNALTATATSPTQINFTATPNDAGNNIIIAWNTTNTFGTPSGPYNAGSQIEGGGTVHYVGSAAGVYPHNSLTEGTTYYYRAWTVVTGPKYSSTYVNASATTYFGVPYVQDFNAAAVLPSGWAGTGTVFYVGTPHGTGGTNGLYRNLYSTYPTSNVSSPTIVVPAGSAYRLVFDYRIVNWSGYPGTATTLGADDKIEVFVSTDNGSHYTLMHTIGQSNHVTSTNFANTRLDLSTYNGPLMFQFVATWDAVEDGDYYVDIDNFKVEVTPTEPIFTATPSSKDFGSVSIFGVSAPQTFTFSNTGIGTLDITSVTLGGTNPGDFVLVDANAYPLTLGEGQSATVQASFDPETAGAKSANIVFTESGDGKATYSVPLTGVGIDPTVVNFPWLEGFEDEFPPVGWTNDSWDDSKYDPPFNGDHFAYSNTDGSTLISPPINLPSDGVSYSLSFWYRAESEDYPQDFDVRISLDGTNFNEVVFVGDGEITEDYIQVVYDLSSFSGQTFFIQFAGYTGTGGADYGILIDDVLINTPLDVTFAKTDLTCNGSNDGTIDLNIVGGAAPYTVLINGPDSFTSDQPSLTNLAAGDYVFVVTDAEQSSIQNTITLTQPAAIPTPTVDDLTVTYNGLIHTVEAVAPEGTVLVWYNAATEGEVTIAPSETNAGVYNAWVAAYDDLAGCESLRVAVVLTINKKQLTVTADNKSRCQFIPNPELTFTYSGFATGEGPENLSTVPTATTTALENSLPDVYPITLSGGVSSNYSFTYVNATLTVIKSPIIYAGPDGAVCTSESFPIVGASASNYTSILWSTSGNGIFNNTSLPNPIYTPGSIDIANGQVTLTLTGDPGSSCSKQDQMILLLQNDLPVSVDVVQVTTDVCVGTLTHFTALPLNGGLTPAYQWKVNANNAGTNSPDFAYVPTNGDVVTVVMTSSIGCALNNPAVSDPLVVEVTQDLIAGVSIFANATSVCDFTDVTFTALPENGGNNPSYQWFVNGQTVGANAFSYTYAPLDGDEIHVVMTSSHACAVVPVATSNTVEMQVAPPYLELFSNPVNGGTTTGSGNYAAGTEVTVVATPTGGWEFLNWKNADGIIISTSATYVHTINYCYEALTATFSSTAKIAGQLKYFNNEETLIPSPNNYGVFYVQLFEGETAVGERQLVRYNSENGMDSYYEYIGVESGKDYKLKVWEQATNNYLGNVWTWNNWGGTTANDALIVGLMTANNPIVTQLPWIAPVAVPDYTALFSKVADLNNSSSLTGVDALLLQHAMTGAPGYMPLPGGSHNFHFATTKLSNHGAVSYPNAPDLVFTPHGNYNATTAASEVYHEILLTNLSDGLNVFNIYLVAAGDVNASYKPGTGAKDASLLNYNGIIASTKDSELVIPVKIDQSASLAAMSLGLSYDNNLIEVIDVEGYPIRFIDAEAGTIRISWVDQNGRNFAAGETLLNVKVKIVGDLNIGDRYFELLEGIEFADMTATVINGISLSTPYIESGVTSVIDLDKLQLTHSSYPNPFKDVTQINYTLPESGKVSVIVYNYFGQEVKVLTQEVQTAGSHQLQLNNFDLRDAGNYFYRITLDGQNKTFSVRGTLVFVK